MKVTCSNPIEELITVIKSLISLKKFHRCSQIFSHFQHNRMRVLSKSHVSKWVEHQWWKKSLGTSISNQNVSLSNLSVNQATKRYMRLGLKGNLSKLFLRQLKWSEVSWSVCPCQFNWALSADFDCPFWLFWLLILGQLTLSFRGSYLGWAFPQILY